ncbi:MAG: hypothetical protein ACI4HJ_02385 [Ruminococcus sp.]
MIEPDTIKLIRECDAGIKMGVTSIDDVLTHVREEKMKNILKDARQEHEKLRSELETMLSDYGDEGKDPNPLAKSMSWMKTNVKLGIENSDGTVADLIIEGCDMGIKSLSRYLNEYKAAEERAKNIAKELIKIEEALSKNMRPFL